MTFHNRKKERLSEHIHVIYKHITTRETTQQYADVPPPASSGAADSGSGASSAGTSCDGGDGGDGWDGWDGREPGRYLLQSLLKERGAAIDACVSAMENNRRKHNRQKMTSTHLDAPPM